jgi:hypothetical protein
VAAAALDATNRALVCQLFPRAAPGAKVALAEAPWFRLALYANTSNWTPQQWHAAVHSRWLVRAELEGHEGTTTPPITRVADFIKGLERDPVSGGLLPQGQALPTTSFDRTAHKPVREVQPVDRGEDFDHRLLSVNMLAADRELIAEFRAWLRQQRAPALRLAMTEDDMRAWAASRVVPYLDLELYGLAAGVKVRPVDLQNALFPAGETKHGADPRKTIEQSTRKFARRLMSVQFFRRLSVQFATRD